jgi:acetylornithine/succinyldiaminopimelate/putrescine aminotransferase
MSDDGRHDDLLKAEADGMHVVRWQPALTMSPEMFARACDLLEDAIAEVQAAR